MTIHPIPLSPSDTETCLKLTSDPPQHVCYPLDQVATAPVERGPGLHLWLGQDDSDMDRAIDSVRGIAEQPADPADAQRLHDLIYPPGLDAAQIVGIAAAVLIALLILAAVIVARRRSAS